jgi:hypothetical protein
MSDMQNILVRSVTRWIGTALTAVGGTGFVIQPNNWLSLLTAVVGLAFYLLKDQLEDSKK